MSLNSYYKATGKTQKGHLFKVASDLNV